MGFPLLCWMLCQTRCFADTSGSALGPLWSSPHACERSYS